MGSVTPNPKKRSYLLPPGCKDLIDVLNGSYAIPSLAPSVRVNGQIQASELRVICEDGIHLGVLPLVEALALAKALGIDLVEIAPDAKPPVCQLVDFGKLRYESAKRRKKEKKKKPCGVGSSPHFPLPVSFFPHWSRGHRPSPAVGNCFQSVERSRDREWERFRYSCLRCVP